MAARARAQPVVCATETIEDRQEAPTCEEPDPTKRAREEASTAQQWESAVAEEIAMVSRDLEVESKVTQSGNGRGHAKRQGSLEEQRKAQQSHTGIQPKLPT